MTERGGVSAGLSLESISAVMDAQSESELLQRLQSAAHALGFEQFMMGIEVSRPLIKPVQHVISGYTMGWQRVYAERDFVWKDPTVTHCKVSPEPLVWSEKMYSEGARELWEESRTYGIGYGVSIPIHERQGVKSMFSLARDQSIDKNQRELDAMVAGARVLASCAHFAMTKLIVPGLMQSRDPQLTQRERECLVWAAKGKTAYEIGMILHIAETTAVFHLNNVVKKFNVANRTQAIAVGVAMGLVH